MGPSNQYNGTLDFFSRQNPSVLGEGWKRLHPRAMEVEDKLPSWELSHIPSEPAPLKMIFRLPRWHVLVPWGVVGGGRMCFSYISTIFCLFLHQNGPLRCEYR